MKVQSIRPATSALNRTSVPSEISALPEYQGFNLPTFNEALAMGAVIVGVYAPLGENGPSANMYVVKVSDMKGRDYKLFFYLDGQDLNKRVSRVPAASAQKFLTSARRPLTSARGGTMLQTANLVYYGAGMDANGNHVVRVGLPNDRAFSIQTNTNCPSCHNLGRDSKSLTPEQEAEVVAYVQKYGPASIRGRLHVYAASAGKHVSIEGGPYAPATLRMNRMGHIEVWPGEKAGEGDAPVYFQFQDDTDAVKEALPPEEWEELEKGYDVTTRYLAEEYFPAAQEATMSANLSAEERAAARQFVAHGGRPLVSTQESDTDSGREGNQGEFDDADKRTSAAMNNEEFIEHFLKAPLTSLKNGQKTNNLKVRKEDGGWSLVNYATVLVFRADDGKAFFNTQRYSVTTSKIQNLIRRYSHPEWLTEIKDEEEFTKIMDTYYDKANGGAVPAEPKSAAEKNVSAEGDEELLPEGEEEPLPPEEEVEVEGDDVLPEVEEPDPDETRQEMAENESDKLARALEYLRASVEGVSNTVASLDTSVALFNDLRVNGNSAEDRDAAEGMKDLIATDLGSIIDRLDAVKASAEAVADAIGGKIVNRGTDVEDLEAAGMKAESTVLLSSAAAQTLSRKFLSAMVAQGDYTALTDEELGKEYTTLDLGLLHGEIADGVAPRLMACAEEQRKRGLLSSAAFVSSVKRFLSRPKSFEFYKKEVGGKEQLLVHPPKGDKEGRLDDATGMPFKKALEKYPELAEELKKAGVPAIDEAVGNKFTQETNGKPDLRYDDEKKGEKPEVNPDPAKG